jgi:Uma2 family endonuclease
MRCPQRLDDPIAIFEVLSPGNVHYDLKRKRRHYETIPSLRLIGFVWPDTVACLFAVRDDAGAPWRDDEAEGIDAVLTIDALGIAIALREVYARTEPAREAG